MGSCGSAPKQEDDERLAEGEPRSDDLASDAPGADVNLRTIERERTMSPSSWLNYGREIWSEQYGADYLLYRESRDSVKNPAEGQEPKLALAMTRLAFASVASFVNTRPHHASSGGALVGRATVLKSANVPKSEFFTPGRTLTAHVRYSSAGYGGHSRDDAGMDIRGCAIKLVATTFSLDLVMSTGQGCGFFNLENFLTFLDVSVSGSDERHREWYGRHPSAATSHISAYKRAPSSYAELDYATQTCLEFIASDGKRYAARFRCVPAGRGVGTPVRPSTEGLPDYDDQVAIVSTHADTHRKRRPGETRAKDYLSAELAARVSAGRAVELRVQIQLRPVSGSYQLFNPSVAWDEAEYPWSDLLSLTLPDYLPPDEADALAFDVGRLPPATLALFDAKSTADYNSLNQARARVYAVSQRARRAACCACCIGLTAKGASEQSR